MVMQGLGRASHVHQAAPVAMRDATHGTGQRGFADSAVACNPRRKNSPKGQPLIAAGEDAIPLASLSTARARSNPAQKETNEIVGMGPGSASSSGWAHPEH